MRRSHGLVTTPQSNSVYMLGSSARSLFGRSSLAAAALILMLSGVACGDETAHPTIVQRVDTTTPGVSSTEPNSPASQPPESGTAAQATDTTAPASTSDPLAGYTGSDVAPEGCPISPLQVSEAFGLPMEVAATGPLGCNFDRLNGERFRVNLIRSPGDSVSQFSADVAASGVDVIATDTIVTGAVRYDVDELGMRVYLLPTADGIIAVQVATQDLPSVEVTDGFAAIVAASM
jgi:hypothetical protein